MSYSHTSHQLESTPTTCQVSIRHSAARKQDTRVRNLGGASLAASSLVPHHSSASALVRAER
eukprot:3181459-Rhodomonas_salina.5